MRTSLAPTHIDALRESFRHLERPHGTVRDVLPFGIKTLDAALPNGGLTLAALHEVAGGGNGGVEGAAAALFAAGIAARETCRLVQLSAQLRAPKQIVSSLMEETEPDVSGLIDLLANRVGEKNLYRIAPVSSDVPERSVCQVPALSLETGAEWPGHWPRPSRLLARPELVDTAALLPDHPPVSFTWRGARRGVKRADSPERVFGEWWKHDPELISVRDYFRIEDDAGERFWVFRVGDGEDPLTGSQRWYLHGIFG